MLGPGLGKTSMGWRDEKLRGPLQDAGVRGSSYVGVILAGDVEIEIEEGLGVGEDEGGEAGTRLVSFEMAFWDD